MAPSTSAFSFIFATMRASGFMPQSELSVTFSGGTYRGTRGPGQGMVWWDAGIYRLEDTKTLVVGTATDELVTYQIALQVDRFEVTDSEGCLVTYRRA